jgi:hypothetical protein
MLHLGARAQDAGSPEDRDWSAAAELTGVWTAGNAESSTFGLNATVLRQWPQASLKLEGGGIRTETVRFTRHAIGIAGDFDVVEETDRQRTAESYYALARYDRELGSNLYVFGGLDWLRNTFAGISSRTVAAAGAGNLWINSDRTRLKTDAGLTYTIQEDVVENPGISSNFAGVRAGLDLWKFISSTTEFTSVVVVDLNLDETDDVRVDWTSSLPVAISSRLALKPSLRLLWRNQPSLAELPLVRPDGSSTGEVVTAPLEKTDVLFTLALVVKL